VYFGKKIDLNLDQINIKNFKPTSNVNYISIPFAENGDPEEEESYKLIKELNVHNMAWGYTCFVSAFAVFVSERKINIQSPVLSAFNNITTVPGFEALKFPVKQVVSEGDQMVKAFEIDLRKQVDIENACKVSKLDCYPILWVNSQPSQNLCTIKFSQLIACKYMVVKLIDSHKNSASDNNIDMYNLSFRGNLLKIPSPTL
jgi:hypothetical protein